jgi:hypothetical protein
MQGGPSLWRDDVPPTASGGFDKDSRLDSNNTNAKHFEILQASAKNMLTCLVDASRGQQSKGSILYEQGSDVS